MTLNVGRKPDDLELAREYARRLRKRLGENLQSVTLYGSRARGDARDGSDFDLVVIVENCDHAVRESVSAVDVGMMDDFDELFVGIVYSEDEWRIESRMPLGWNVANEGVAL